MCSKTCEMVKLSNSPRNKLAHLTEEPTEGSSYHAEKEGTMLAAENYMF